MSTPILEQESTPAPAPRRRLALVAAAAVFAVAVAGVAVAVNRGGGEAPVASGPPLELSLGAGDSMASCIMFDVAFLADMSPAFEGTATSVDGERVTLRVDRWFAGGDAAEVTLVGTPGLEALIGGVTFEEGSTYLITAADGVVNYCGYSGEATPELRSAFEEAFPG